MDEHVSLSGFSYSNVLSNAGVVEMVAALIKLAYLVPVHVRLVGLLVYLYWKGS